jgi:chromate reductase
VTPACRDLGAAIRENGDGEQRGRMSGAPDISVLGICGSLRARSYNMAALRTAIELKPPGMTIGVADISAFPLYNEDVRAQGFPPVVETFRRQIREADALLFATPEYNYSMSGS